MEESPNFTNFNPDNNLPPDMWDDRDLTPPQPIIVPKKFHYGGQWWLTLLLILLITGGAGYLASRYWPDIANWANSLIYNVPSTTNDRGTGINDDQVAWQPRVLISDLGLLTGDSSVGSSLGFAPVSLAKYYKVGQFISGPYDKGDLIIAALPNDNVVRFYYFARSQNDLILLSKHSPELSENSRIDQSKFSINRDYQIAKLFFPTQLNNPRLANEPLILVSSVDAMGDHWFDESMLTDNWQKVFIDPIWGDVYTDPLPENTSSTNPRYGFYLSAPDGTIRTYQLTASILRDDILQNGIPVFVWADGTSSGDSYIMFEMDKCVVTNLATVMPNTLMSELIIAAATSDPDRPIYELKDKNHILLKTLFKSASSRTDNKGLTYQKFLDNHPIFFWQDSFGRLIKFQNKNYIALTDCP